MVLMFLIQFLLPAGQRWFHRETNSPAPSSYTTASRNGLARPWGDIAYMPLALSRPDAYFTNVPPPPEKTEWTLRNTSRAALSTLIGSLGLEDRERNFLSDSSHWQELSGALRITVPPDVVLNIPPISRQRLYALLAQSAENAAQQRPFRFAGFAEWFGDSGLPEEKLELVGKLTYTNDEALCFADLAAFAQLSSPAETALLIKSLSRVPTFMVRLHIDPEAKVDELLNYWAKAGNLRDARLLFQSLSRADSDINLSYFLPPFARLRLYTYPQREDPRAAERNDIWTAMNFFNKEPEDRFLSADSAAQILMTDYTRVASKDKQFGDTIVFVAQNRILHMGTFLAEDFVFTKRASGPFEPWVIIKVKELITASLQHRPFEIRVYRRNKLPPLAAGSWSERDFVD